MNILALECSSKIASVAVWSDGIILVEEMLNDQITHSQIIMPMLESCLEKIQMNVRQMNVIACDIGPGSFTGIRIGVSTTNALSLSTGAKQVSINSLESLAANALFFNGKVIPILDARSNRIYSSIYDTKSGLPIQQCELYAGTIEDLLSKLVLKEKYLFIGDGAQAQYDKIKNYIENAYFMPEHLNHHKASSIAFLASEKVYRGNFSQSCQPLYMRASQAEQQREKNEL